MIIYFFVFNNFNIRISFLKTKRLLNNSHIYIYIYIHVYTGVVLIKIKNNKIII